MAKFTMTHEINCGAERFWQLFFDKEFNDALYKGKLGFPKFEIVDFKETDATIYRKAVGQPKMNMPGPIVKLLGSNFAYTDEGTLDKKTGLFKFKTTPSTLADKLKNEGSVRIEALGTDKLKRITELLIEAKVFGLGGLIESSTEKQMRQGWDDSAVFMNQYLIDHKQG
jgi:uncharacterized protein DUF2505